MKSLPVNKNTIIKRLDEIQRCVEKLKKFEKMSFDEFNSGENFAVSEHYLRRALEAVFEIGAHILARLPGGITSSYKEIAKKLGEYKIIPSQFARDSLIKMAGYRNRLVHFYFEVSIEELYEIIRKDLKDFDVFTELIKKFLLEPEKFGLKVE